MSYIIKYDGAISKKYNNKTGFSRKKMRTVMIFCGIVFIMMILLQISSVRRLLLPGDPEITERAIVKMTEELKAGESIHEAVSTFCREVIDGGLAG